MNKVRRRNRPARGGSLERLVERSDHLLIFSLFGIAGNSETKPWSRKATAPRGTLSGCEDLLELITQGGPSVAAPPRWDNQGHHPGDRAEI